MASQLPATSPESALPTPATAPPAGQPAAPPPRPGQNVTIGLYPLALAGLVILFLGLAFWTLMAVTGGAL